MSRMVNVFATTCLRLPVKDCSGSWCYRVEALAKLGLENLRVNGYAGRSVDAFAPARGGYG